MDLEKADIESRTLTALNNCHNNLVYWGAVRCSQFPHARPYYRLFWLTAYVWPFERTLRFIFREAYNNETNHSFNCCILPFRNGRFSALQVAHMSDLPEGKCLASEKLKKVRQ